MNRSIARLLLLLIFFCSSAAAEYREAIRWDRLVEELGPTTPDGTGVEVSLVESKVSGNYAPDQANMEFVDKTFRLMSGESGNSSHATVVGQYFFGNTISMAGGIDVIDVYEANDWLGSFLQVGQPVFPSVETNQIQNHSWVGSYEETEFNVEAMRRLDYAIERDRFVAVVGLRNDTAAVPPLLAHAYNVITVGRPSGVHSRGGTWFDEPGRSRPDIVTPGNFFTSYSVAVISSAAALLLEEAERSPGLSNALNHPQAIKAILLAGAQKEPFPEWTRTNTQPLDPVFGAGQLDIYQSHRILVSGEHAPGEGIVPAQGWHLGTLDSGGTAEIYLSFETNQESFAAHLSWHRQLLVEEADFDKATVMLGQFELRLSTMDENGNPELQISRDPVNNGQHLYLRDLPAGDYLLEIRRTDEGDFEVVHALAWNGVAEAPTTFADWQTLFFSVEERMQPAISGPEADPDGDGIPNLLEYGLGGNPRSANRGVLPAVGISIVEDSEYLSLTFNRPADLLDVLYRVDASSNLAADWVQDVGVLVSSQPNGDGTITEIWRDTEPVANGKRFLRLAVIREDSAD